MLFSQQFFAQSPAIEWQRCFGGPAGDYAFDVAPTKDGGYIIAGETEANGGDVAGYHGNPLIGDILIIKTDKTGNIEWRRTLGGIFVERSLGTGIQQTNDGGYILAASAASKDCDYNNTPGLDIIVIKLDKDGNMLWNKSYGGSQNEYAYSMAPTPDGGYIVSGNSGSSDGDVTGHNGGYFDAWVIKISGSGTLEWQKNFGGSDDDEFTTAAVTADGNYIVAGYTFSTDGDIKLNHGTRDFYVVKLSTTGDVIWQKTYGGTYHDIAQSMKATPDGGTIIVGLTSSNDMDVSGNHQSLGLFGDFWVVKLDKTGTIQWQKCYGGTYNEWAFSVELTNDGGYLIGGSAESPDGDVGCNYGLTDSWLIKTDGKGNLQWHKNMGGSLYDEIHGLKLLQDGSIVFSGHTCSPEINGHHAVTVTNATCADFFMVKLAPPGVKQKPSVTIEGNPLICNGNVTLRAQAKFAGIKYTYSWFKNGISTGANSILYTGTGLKDGDKITCELNTIDECDDVSSATVSAQVVLKNNTKIIDPAVTISADNTTVCNCTAITFSTSVVNKSDKPGYEWFVNDINTGYTDKTFTTKMLQPGDAVKCIYTSNSACILNSSSISNIIQINGGSAVTPTVSITASESTVCKGSPVTFTALAVNAGSNPSFQWAVNNINTGSNDASFTTSVLKNNDVISCTVTADPSFQCALSGTATSNIITMQVTNKVIPAITISTSATTICSGNSITFHAAFANAGNNPSFQWQINGANAGMNDSVFTTSSLKDKDAVTCIIKTDPLFTCAGNSSDTSNKINVTVNNGANPTVNITASANDVCYETPITFNANVINGGNSLQYEWLLNNTAVGSNISTYTSNKLLNGDNIKCIITPGGSACSTNPVTSNNIVLQINPLPVISISPADTFINAGNTVQFNTTVTGTIQSFEWQPENKLQDASMLSPKTIVLTNDQLFSFTVINDKGCIAKQNAIVKITYPFYMPNAFTPNGDGVNDIFRIPPHTSITLKNFAIYNRLGQKIFSTTDINKGWDGTINGNPFPMDTFVYVINGSDTNGTISIKGTFVLIR